MKSKTMNIVTWVAHGILSVMMLMPAAMKMMTPYEELKQQMPWAEDFSANQIMMIAIAELLGVIGMNVPFILKKFKKLVPIASVGLALTMAGAVMTHIGRDENFIPPLLILLIALFVTYARKDLLSGSSDN